MPAAGNFRPEWIRPALYGSYHVDTAAPLRIEKDTSIVCAGCQHQLTVFKPAQVFAPEPGTRQTTLHAYPLRLLHAQKHMIITGRFTAATAARTGKIQVMGFEEWLHDSRPRQPEMASAWYTRICIPFTSIDDCRQPCLAGTGYGMVKTLPFLHPVTDRHRHDLLQQLRPATD